MSASESICAPNFDVAFNSRARRPSMPSRKAATSTITTAVSKRCSKARRMPDRPAQIASTVIRLGSTMRIGISRMRGPPRPWGSKGTNTVYETRTSGVRRRAAEFGQHGFAADRRLADGDAQRRRPGQEDVDARAEADQAETLADADIGAGLGPADDAARHQPGDLHDGDRAVGAVDDQAVALVLAARLVELGIEEFARRDARSWRCGRAPARGSRGRKRRS